MTFGRLMATSGTSNLYRLPHGAHALISALQATKEASTFSAGLDTTMNTSLTWSKRQWTRLAEETPFQSSGGVLLFYDTYLVLVGGFGLNMDQGLWTSDNGFDWSYSEDPETPARLWSPRKYHGAVIVDDRLHVLGGLTAEGYYDNTVYSMSIFPRRATPSSRHTVHYVAILFSKFSSWFNVFNVAFGFLTVALVPAMLHLTYNGFTKPSWGTLATLMIAADAFVLSLVALQYKPSQLPVDTLPKENTREMQTLMRILAGEPQQWRGYWQPALIGTTLMTTLDMTCRAPRCVRDESCGMLGTSHSLGCCRDYLYLMLQDVASWLDREGIAYFLMYGTLLGSVRDEDIISYTRDADIVVDPVYWPRLSKGLAEGFFGHRKYALALDQWDNKVARVCPDYEGFPTSSWVPGGLQDGAEAWERGVEYHLDVYSKDWWQVEELVLMDCVYPLNTTVIRGRHFSAPGRPVQCLEKLYGADWLIPKKGLSGVN